jgi:hypothetical protein
MKAEDGSGGKTTTVTNTEFVETDTTGVIATNGTKTKPVIAGDDIEDLKTTHGDTGGKTMPDINIQSFTNPMRTENGGIGTNTGYQTDSVATTDTRCTAITTTGITGGHGNGDTQKLSACVTGNKTVKVTGMSGEQTPMVGGTSSTEKKNQIGYIGGNGLKKVIDAAYGYGGWTKTIIITESIAIHMTGVDAMNGS